MVAFYVYKSSLSVANATNTVITGWSESFDLDSWFASDKYTPQSAGKYVFFYSARANTYWCNCKVYCKFIKRMGQHWVIQQENLI